MRQLLLILGLLFSGLLFTPAAAQQDEDDFTPEQVAPGVFTVQVFVDSAFAHLAPESSALASASIFEGDILEAVGRNVDGTWFEVRRPGRAYKLGWVSDEFVSKDFSIELLPLTDSVTGVTGPTPIVDSGYGVFVQQESVLRGSPSLTGARVGVVPYGVTVPAIERNQDASWIYVNYLGTAGWISGFNVRRDRLDTLAIPEGTNLPPLETLIVEIIPPEIQLAQVEALRTYINQQLAIARSLESFWWNVFQGEVMPCNPPSEITDYIYDAGDQRELPELGRIVPRLSDGVESLNGSIGVLQNCGALVTNDVLAARNAAINAKVIFSAGLGQLANLEENVIR
ncbi:MAG: SH3 domain-containing protein [Anaerolineae bacterium]|nr:SH3 domain-containing protein [Anaerolineae bacterium]